MFSNGVSSGISLETSTRRLLDSRNIEQLWRRHHDQNISTYPLFSSAPQGEILQQPAIQSEGTPFISPNLGRKLLSMTVKIHSAIEENNN